MSVGCTNVGPFPFFFLQSAAAQPQSSSSTDPTLNAPTISNSSAVVPRPPSSNGSADNIGGRNGGGGSSGTVFSPIVTATCRTGIMTIKVETLNNFIGVVHSRDYRKPRCSGYGENTKVTFLRVNMLAEKDESDYCGVFYSQVRKNDSDSLSPQRIHAGRQ